MSPAQNRERIVNLYIELNQGEQVHGKAFGYIGTHDNTSDGEDIVGYFFCWPGKAATITTQAEKEAGLDSLELEGFAREDEQIPVDEAYALLETTLDEILAEQDAYYVVECEYVGPDKDRHTNDHTYEITSTPPRTNSSHEICTDGWLGTTNDWARTAHGAFETEADAREAVQELLSAEGYREQDLALHHVAEGVVAVYLVGRHEAMDAEASQTWAYESTRAITAETTDAKITALVDEAEEAANEEGLTLNTRAVREMLEERRDKLVAEAKEEDEE